jgi:iron complex transport system substrate-binding protein
MKKIVSLVLVVLMVLTLAACGAPKAGPAADPAQTPAGSQPANPVSSATEAPANPTEAPEEKDESFDIVDSAGRTVHFDKPAVTCCTGYQGGSFLTLCAFFGDKVADHIVSWDGLLPNWAAVYDKFCEAVPGLKDIPVVGNFQPDKLDVEALIASKPDVAIIPYYYFNLDGIHDKVVPQLEAAGIPCVCTNYRRDELPEHLHCMEILGKIFGQEERAKALADFYESSVNLVYDRVDKLMGSEEGPSFYVEYTYKGIDSWAGQMSYSNASQWGNILTSVGATTIYADAPEWYPTVEAEYVLASDPENILILAELGKKPPECVSIGIDMTENMVQEILDGFNARPGWSTLSAVKNKNVYTICNSLTHDIFSFYCFQQTAKIVWPEEFADLDPDKTLADFFHEFMPFELEGVWFYQVQ